METVRAIELEGDVERTRLFDLLDSLKREVGGRASAPAATG